MKIPSIAAHLLVAIATFNGCAMPTPQQNLDDQLKALVGRSIDVPRYALRPELLLEQRTVAGEVLQFHYRYSRGCVLIVEVQSTTRVIIAAWAEGGEKSCILPP